MRTKGKSRTVVVIVVVDDAHIVEVVLCLLCAPQTATFVSQDSTGLLYEQRRHRTNESVKVSVSRKTTNSLADGTLKILSLHSKS